MAESRTKSGADVQAEVAHAVDHLDLPSPTELRWGTMQPDEMGGTQFVPIAKAALRFKVGDGVRPPFDVSMPNGETLHIIEEGRAQGQPVTTVAALTSLSAR